MAQNHIKSKKKKNKSKKKNSKKSIKPTSYADVHHVIDRNDNSTDYKTLLRNIKDNEILTGCGHTIHTLLYYAVTKPNIIAAVFLIKECKKRFIDNNKYSLSSVLNLGNQINNQTYEITPLTKILLTLRKLKLNKQRLQYRHLALLLIGNGVNVNCKSVMEPHKHERKSAKDYQIVEPIEIAFSLYDPEIFLAIMFRNINNNIENNTDPLSDIQCKVRKLWYNQYNGVKLNLIKLQCNDCSLDIFAEALRYLYILKCRRKSLECSIKSIINEDMIKYYKIINNASITQVTAIKKYYDSPQTVDDWQLGIDLTFDPWLKYAPCFVPKTYHKQRLGLGRLIAVLPNIYNLKQLHITWKQKREKQKKQQEEDDKHCIELLRSLNIQCQKYGTITDIKLNGFHISTKSMNWLSDSIIKWNIGWTDSVCGLITMGYIRTNLCMPIDVIFKIYKYCFDKKRHDALQMECKTNTFRQLNKLSLINVGLNNDCIGKLCHAMKTSAVLRVNELVLNKNAFNIIGLSNICRYIEETDCVNLKHLEIKNCHRLDLKQSHYPCQIFLVLMSCLKQYNLVLFDDNDEKQKCEENYDSICECLFKRYQKYFVHQHYISSHLFPAKSKSVSSSGKLKRKKQMKRPTSARAASTKTFFGSKSSTPPKITRKTFFGAPSPALNVELSTKANKRTVSVPSLNQSATKMVGAKKLKMYQSNKHSIHAEPNGNLFDASTMTPKKDIWEEITNDIIEKCTKMRVLTENEKNIYFEKKKVNGMTHYRIPVIKSSDNLSTKLYLEKHATDKKSKHASQKSKLGNHSHDLQKTRETKDFLKYDAEHKYLFIQIASIEHMLIEFDRIQAFEIKYLYVKLCSKKNCSLRIYNGIKIDCMFCVENAKEIIFTKDCKITTIQMWLNNTNIIRIQPDCVINTVTSWYYQVNKILNKGTLKHIAHCFVENSHSDSETIFRNKNEIITYGYFYCNLDKFENINGQITTNVIHHVKCNQYNCFESDHKEDNNGKTNVFGIAFYEINERCNINDEINGNVLLFDCEVEFVLEGKLNAQKQCFIHCNKEITFQSNCTITCSRSGSQLREDIFQQTHPKIFGYNYDTFTQLPSNRTTPLLWIKSKSFVTNHANIHDGSDKNELNPLLKCILTFDITEKCEINNLRLSSNNKIYLLNTQNITINSSTFDTNEFYVNTMNDIECRTSENLNCINKNKIQNIKIISTTINANELYINNTGTAECIDQTNINCGDVFRVTNTNQFKTINKCGIYVNQSKHWVNDTSELNQSYECVFDVNDMVSIEGSFKGHNIKVTVNECTIDGSVDANRLLLMVKDKLTFITCYEESVEINNLFCVTLQGTDVLMNDEALLIQAPNDTCKSVLCISNQESLLSIKDCELTSKTKLEVFKMNKFQIESSSINTNHILIHNIDLVECINKGNINCCNKFEMTEVNKYKLLKDCTLSLERNSNVTSEFNEGTIKIEDFFLEEGATIHCTFESFYAKCDNQIELNGKISVGAECNKFELQAINYLLVGETCRFECMPVYENSSFHDEEEKAIRNNTESVTEFLMQRNLDNDLKDACYISLWSDIKIEVHGNIKGDKSLFILNCNGDITVSENSKFALYCLFINCRKNVDFKGSFNCKHGELGICSNKSLNINTGNICSWLLLFHSEDMHINGTIETNRIHGNATTCNIKAESIVANILLLEIKEKVVCTGVMTVHESGVIECNKECRLQNAELIANYAKKEESYTREVVVPSETNDKIKLTIRALSLYIDNSKIIDENKCDATFDISDRFTISNSKLILKSELNILNAKNFIINSSSITTNTLLFKDIHCIDMNQDANVTSFNKLKAENIDNFQMNDNCQLSIEYSADCENSTRECIMETNNLFCMDSESNIYCTFKHFKMKSNDKIQILGKIWLNESCKFEMLSSNQLLIASTGEILSQLNYVKKEKTKFLQKKTVNKQDLLDNVNINLNSEYYMHLYCDNTINIYGKIIGKKSLIIIDSNREINIFDNGRVNGGETYIRSMNNISFSGTIDNDCGDCFIAANGTLHLKKSGRICLLFLLFYGGHVIDECFSKTAANMSLNDVEEQLSKIMDKINNFESYKTEKLNKYSKKIKLQNAKKMFKFYDDEVNATIDKTGLDENNIGKFLKLMNKLLFMTLQQQEHLILLDVKLSKFIELIDREFNYKLSMETYFEDKNLSKLVATLKNSDFDELNKLICNDDDEFENKILPLLTSIKINLREEREIRKICLKPEIWKKYQNEKENIITRSLSEICPTLSLFFNQLNIAMKQTQMKALNSLNQSRSMSSLAIQTINVTNSTAKESLNVIAKFTKKDQMVDQNEINKQKVQLLIWGFLREILNNLKASTMTTLNKLILGYYYSSENANNGILKVKALTFVTGIEECCSEIIGNQEQMTESIFLSKSILQFKPKTFKKPKKKKKQIKKSKKKDTVSKPIISPQNDTTEELKTLPNESQNSKKQQEKISDTKEETELEMKEKEKFEVKEEEKSEVKEKEKLEFEVNLNSCEKLLSSWNLIKYYSDMKAKGWNDPSDWCKLTDDYLKYHLNFKRGHIARFKRLFSKWYKKFSLSTENKVGKKLCKSLLTNWRLMQYFDEILKQEWQEPNDWMLLTDEVLKNELKFKRGHIARFKRKYKKWCNQQQKKSVQNLSSNSCKTVAVVSKAKQTNKKDMIKIRKRQQLDLDSMDSEQLWNVVENGIENILLSDINVIKMSMKYFGFFGQFGASFDKFVQQENLLKRGWTKLTNLVSKTETITNKNQQSALEDLIKEIAEFSKVKNEFSVTITQLKTLALGCMEDIVKIMPNAETFKIAQINREKYQNIFLKKQQEYGNKVLELNDEYDTLFKQQIKLSAQKSALEYEMQQRS